MKKIAILCDSSADIADATAQELGIHVLRFPIFVEEKEYEETTNLSYNELSHFLKEEKKVSTSMPSPGKLKSTWDTLLETYDEILYIPISNKLSGVSDTAILLANTEYENRVFVVNSHFLTKAITELCKDALALSKQGYDAKTLKERIEKEITMEAMFLPRDLETLKRGGRISPAIASLAGLLKIKVLIKFGVEGYLEKYDTVRSQKKAYDILVNAISDVTNPQEYHWGILHSDDKETAILLQTKLSEKLQQNIVIDDIYAIIRAHCGNGTVGIYRIKKLQ